MLSSWNHSARPDTQLSELMVLLELFIKHCETPATFDKVVGNVRGVNWCLVLNLKLFELLTKYVESKRYYKVRGKGVNFSVEHRGVN